MTGFVRTASGIANSSLFYKVDYVVFAEGEHDDRDSIDGLFWRHVFASWLPARTIRVKLVGGKPNVKRIARQIVTRNLSRSLAVMDRDYDEFRGRLIVDPRVIYTLGYSVENDLCNIELVADMMAAITRKPALSDAQRAALDAGYARLAGECTTVVGLDYSFFCSGRAVIDRERPGRTVTPSHQPGVAPSLNRQGVMGQIREARFAGGYRHTRLVAAVAPPVHLVGKIWIFATYHLVVALIKTISPALRVSKDHFLDVLLQEWRGFSARHPTHPVSEHYSAACAAL